MKRILSMWAILMLCLFVSGGLAIAQEEKEEAAEGKTVETHIITQTPSGCQSMMQQMPGMMPGGMMGCGKMGGMGQGGMECGMGCGPCCEQLNQLGCPCYLIGMAEELELSEEQVANLKAICAEHKKDVIRKQAEVKIAEMELKELVAMPNADLTKVKAKITEIGSMRQSMCLTQLATIEKAHKVLTAEQMKKFKEMKKKMCCQTGKPCMMPKVKKLIKMKVEE